ncbi:preprotein translocase subunit SecG [Desulfonatronovibrio magnus]|uniref:preprotein translocase subunit SecG n=1 Tax=Desulfonatronovibrio magnus TaxID=698827 RepID=UPI0005EADC8E|nr:preprotein translocase subunit SecG [Desulfonatronovibrio magnus]RQD65418.1 MAG: preprotein translocase subunit SecG [Desulfonatronovibrio sp. MSAO_Bac4]
MQTLIITIHIISCITLVVLVLLQSGQQGMGVIFGGGGGSLFGSSGAGGILTKLTVGVAAVFFCTSLTFTYMSAKKHTTQPSSIILDETRRDEMTPSLPVQTPIETEENSAPATQ